MNIGILYPRSDAYPHMTKAFIDGIKIYFKKQGISAQVQLFSEAVGYGALEKEVYEKAEKLLVIEEVDVLVGFIDLKVIELLQPLVQASGKLMLVVNPGANLPQNWVAQPNFIFLTLQHAFLCWLTGALAAEKKGGKAVLVSNFYDCGYGHTSTMVNNFMTHGGDICYNYINRQLPGELYDVTALIDFLKTDTTAKKLLCLNNSDAAEGVYLYLNNYENRSDLELFVSPMMFEADALEGIEKEVNFTVNGYKPWLSSSTEKANLEFKEACLAETQKEATIFSLLGWEAAMILEQVLLSATGAYNDVDAIVQTIAAKAITGPRGEMKLDTQTNYITAPFAKGVIKPGQIIPDLEIVPFPENLWKEFIQQPTDASASGWKNTYLCY